MSRRNAAARHRQQRAHDLLDRTTAAPGRHPEKPLGGRRGWRTVRSFRTVDAFWGLAYDILVSFLSRRVTEPQDMHACSLMLPASGKAARGARVPSRAPNVNQRQWSSWAHAPVANATRCRSPRGDARPIVSVPSCSGNVRGAGWNPRPAAPALPGVLGGERCPRARAARPSADVCKRQHSSASVGKRPRRRSALPSAKAVRPRHVTNLHRRGRVQASTFVSIRPQASAFRAGIRGRQAHGADTRASAHPAATGTSAAAAGPWSRPGRTSGSCSGWPGRWSP